MRLHSVRDTIYRKEKKEVATQVMRVRARVGAVCVCACVHVVGWVKSMDSLADGIRLSKSCISKPLTMV